MRKNFQRNPPNKDFFEFYSFFGGGGGGVGSSIHFSLILLTCQLLNSLLFL